MAIVYESQVGNNMTIRYTARDVIVWGDVMHQAPAFQQMIVVNVAPP